MKDLLERGRKQRREDKRFIASAIAREFTINKKDLNDAHFVAIMAAMINGSWEFEAVVKTLHTAEIDTRFHDIEREFMKSGILIHTGQESLQFSTEFLAISDEITERLIKIAPAKMMPLTKKPDNWTEPHRYDCNLQIVSNLSDNDLERITLHTCPDFYEAVNNMQAVAYKIPCYFPKFLSTQLKPLNQEIREIRQEAYQHYHPQAKKRLNKKARGLEQKRVQILSQIALLKELQQHDKLYFIVTADYRGRLYYRGGIVTPQGNDFCKAAFQLASK